MLTCGVFKNIGQGAVALSQRKRDVRKVPQWYCVHTKPASELQAVQNLRKIPALVDEQVGDINTYFPQIRTKVAVAGVSRQILRPLFPRYFFAELTWEKAARFVNSRPYILGLVQFGEFPAIVPDQIIADLKELSLESNVEVVDPLSHLKPGQRVLIKSGLFKGMEGEFLSRSNGSKRVSLLLNYLQSHTKLILEHPHLQPI